MNKQKNILRVLICVVILLCIGVNTAKAYDFSSANSTGVTIYYTITSTSEYTAEVAPSPDASYSGNLVIPSTVSYNGNTYSITSIGERAFAEYDNLLSVTMPNTIKTIKAEAFSYCTGLTSLVIPNSVTNIYNNAFEYCVLLQSVTIPSSVTVLGGNVFYNCWGLISVVLPNNMEYISSYAFANCNNLKEINMPDSLETIDGFAFYNCSSLQSLILPSTLHGIGFQSFAYCSGLNFLICKASVPPSIDEEDSFKEDVSTIPFYVPCSSLSVYSNENDWNYFTNYRGFSSDTLITAQIATGTTYTLNGFNADTTGFYVHATDAGNGCYDLSILDLTVGTNGLNDITNKEDNINFFVYPNPAGQTTTISVEGLNAKTDIILYDFQGRAIRTYTLNKGQKELEINVKDLAQGIYNVRIGNVSQKLIVR